MAEESRVVASEALRQYYLQQIGIQTWVKRPPASKNQRLRLLVNSLSACANACYEVPENFTRGNPDAPLLVVTEMRQPDEDRLLNRMLQSIGVTEQDVYITTALNHKAEVCPQCMDYLSRQLALVSPAVVLTLGESSCYPADAFNIPVNLRVLLQQPVNKKSAWHCLLQVKSVLQGG